MGERCRAVHMLGMSMGGVVAGLVLSLACLPATASEAYPARPIRLVVPVVPGGGADIVARLLAEKMGKQLGTTVVVDNKAGGSGTIAALDVARAAPDGYTLMQCFVATHSTNPAVLKLRYDPIADFTPVGMMARTSNVLVVSPPGPQSFQQFMSMARTQPGRLSYASAGSGSATHLIMEYLENRAKVDLVHVPYKGAAPAMQDLLSGQVDAMFPSLTTALPHLRSGRLRALAVASAQRDPLLPEVPTVAEMGFAGFSAIQWWGLCAPSKTPAHVVAQLNQALNAAVALPDVRQRLSELAAEPAPMSPQQFGDFLAVELNKWVRLVKDARLQIDP